MKKLRWRTENSIYAYVNMLFKPKLREACRREYGDEFARQYDDINSGMPFGNFYETIQFVEKVDTVRKKMACE